MDKKEDKRHENSGRKPDQRMKPFLVMQYLIKNSDENNVAPANKILDFLENHCGIEAERRSIYKDINEINKAVLMLENGIDIAEATQWLEDDEYNEERFIVYDKNRKGFYVRNRNYDANDIRLLAECVYAAKFLEQYQTELLIDIVCQNVSYKNAEKIKHDVFLTDRVRTNNAEVLNNVITINEAMSKELGGEKHIPEKISFKYLKHTISDVKKQVERRQGEAYVVSPFALLLNDGNYYLLAFDDKKQKFVHYRVDRMKKVERIGEKRDGVNDFFEIDLKSYTQRVFSMYGGEERRVTLRFINPLLDAVIDRFGKKNVQYSKSDERHFTVTTKVEVSDQFFGWLLGFGKKAQLVSPPDVREQFTAYIDRIREMY